MGSHHKKKGKKCGKMSLGGAKKCPNFNLRILKPSYFQESLNDKILLGPILQNKKIQHS